MLTHIPGIFDGLGPALDIAVENCSQHTLVSSGIILADILYKLLYILALRISVHRAGILAYRETVVACKGRYLPLLCKYEGSYDIELCIVQIGKG